MLVTRIHIASHRGANRTPSSGDVWFDDGKSYGWLRDSHDATRFRFFVYRTQGGESSQYSFNSIDRERALTAHFGG